MLRLSVLALLFFLIGCSSTPTAYIDSEYNGIYLRRDISSNSPNYTVINTTCVAISKNVYFFIENGLAVEPDILWDLILNFEERLPTFIKVFGKWKDVDKNKRLTFIIANINPTVMGYYSRLDSLKQKQVDSLYSGYKSNEADILYITYDYLKNDNWKQKGDKVIATLFHELSHAVINDNRKDSSRLPLWLEEGLARYAEYRLSFENIFANDSSNIELISKEPGYPIAFLFIKHLACLYGDDIIKKIISSKGYGLDILFFATGKTFAELFSHFLMQKEKFN